MQAAGCCFSLQYFSIVFSQKFMVIAHFIHVAGIISIIGIIALEVLIFFSIFVQ